MLLIGGLGDRIRDRRRRLDRRCAPPASRSTATPARYTRIRAPSISIRLGYMLGRLFLLALAVILVRIRRRPRRRADRALVIVVAFTAAARSARRSRLGQAASVQRMSHSTKQDPAGRWSASTWLGFVVLIAALRLRRTRTTVPDPERVQARSTGSTGASFSINRAVVYLLLATILTIVTMLWISRRMHARPNQRADRGRGDLLADARQHHSREHVRLDGEDVVSVPRRLCSCSSGGRTSSATCRCRPTARRSSTCSACTSPRSRCTPRPRTSRFRWSSRSSCSSPSTSSASASRARSATSRAWSRPACTGRSCC